MKEKDQNAWKYRQFLWRSWAIQASWNYERQMNMGFMYGIAPILDNIYKNPEDEAMKKRSLRAAYDVLQLYPSNKCICVRVNCFYGGAILRRPRKL